MRDTDRRIIEDYGSIESYINIKEQAKRKETLDYVKKFNSFIKSFHKSRNRKGYKKKYKNAIFININDIS